MDPENLKTASFVSGYLTACGNLACLDCEYRRAGLWNWDSEKWSDEQELADSFLQYFLPSEKPKAVVRSIPTDNLKSHLTQLIHHWISMVAHRTAEATTRIFEDANYADMLTQKNVETILRACEPERAYRFEMREISNPDIRCDEFVSMINFHGEAWIFFLESTL